MEESIKQIGQRLRGLREVLNIPAEEVADLCDISLEHYLKIEAGEADPSVYRLSKISKRYGIDLDVLLFGEEPRMSTYFLTRYGQGPEIDRGDSYKYQSLAGGFRGRKVDPFLTQVDPLPDGKKYNKNTHNGQEFDAVIEGQLEITIDDKELVLSKGDTIYFDGRRPHCMRALGGEPAKFLCVVI
ncbi:cupin domain protein [Prevotella sp. DNF00663]|uniref:helix-turn-helix domain-containing protein n=1 Tax=unclassified Prevotella TaxID=2638335 RepID=UPI000514701A|nr:MULTISPECIES: XRE family transcriptional regulator [unclassified Prevotella]KGI61308.1 transcriptional regulator [Prevotella sp. S7 MS 2]KXB79462.1 cupin domain protein [Prevotella sp. DNF00663]